MIRINLLAVRPRSSERLDALLSPGGSSTFISGREGLLGGLFLIFTVVILGVLAYRFSSDVDQEPPIVAAEEHVTAPEPAPPPPAPVAADPEPAQEPEPDAPAAAEPEPSEPQPKPVAAAPTPAAKPTPRRPSSAPVAAVSGTAGGSARALTAIRVTPLEDRVDIFIEMPDAPTVSSFNVDNPPRVVFDIPGAQLQVADALRDQAVDSPLVKRMRIAQNKFSPPLVRLVLEVGAFPETNVSTSAAGMSIRVTPAQ